MKTNLKILDKFDKTKNIYELIVQCAERTHVIMSGALPDVETENSSIPNISMEELLTKELLKQESKK